MSLHEDLSIYKDADALLDLAFDLQKHIQREYRLVLGQSLAIECKEILLQVGRANKAMGAARLRQLGRLAEHIEAATILLRVGYRKKAVARQAWAKSIDLTNALGKQCTGWRRQTLEAMHEAASSKTASLFASAPAA